MKKQLKDLFVFKEGSFQTQSGLYKIVQVYYNDKRLGTGTFAIKKNGFNLSGFSYQDFSKYFSLSRKELLDMIVEYMSNTYEDKTINP